ncbi:MULTISPECIES: hypothetical protein [unclassified Exiguobacterium]|uniref:hypothetical protein n=1 Tax=unclassified Exiguobacterium TaxID=2644629 RepID=UPI001BECB11B|nr:MULTISPECIES: hypothetical protein [unclassified Exiguobacterium]
MNKFIIKTHKFDEAKKQLENFSVTEHDELKLDNVEVSGGLFDWFNHKVTGEELNDVIKQIQNNLMKSNSLHKKIIEEFGQVYNALEALDKEYIQGILISIKAAEEASKEAKEAQKEISKSIKVQRQTIEVLKNFKEKLDKYEHLEKVDDVWKYVQVFNGDVQNINHKIEIIEQMSKNHFDAIAKLNQFKKELSDLTYLKYVDELWEENNTSKINIKLLSNKIIDIEKKIIYQNKIVDEFGNFKDKINKVKHIYDIDLMWKDVKNIFGNIDNLNLQISNVKQVIEIQNKNLLSINKFVETISEYNHLYKIDQLWEEHENSKTNIRSLNDQLSNNQKELISQKQSINIIEEFKMKLEKLHHLYDVDQLWVKSQEFSSILNVTADQIEDMNRLAKARDEKIESISKFTETISEYQHLNDIDELWIDFQKNKIETNVLIEENHNLSLKIKNVYFLAAGSLGITLIHFILNLVGVLR